MVIKKIVWNISHLKYIWYNNRIWNICIQYTHTPASPNFKSWIRPWNKPDVASTEPIPARSGTLWHVNWDTICYTSLQLRHNERDGVSNHRCLGCLLIVCSGVDQRKHQSTASLTFVRGIYRWTVDSPHKGPVTWKMFPVDKNVSVADGVFLGTSAQAENLELLKRMHISHLLNVAGLPAGIRHTRASRFKDIPVTYEELPIDDVD